MNAIQSPHEAIKLACWVRSDFVALTARATMHAKLSSIRWLNQRSNTISAKALDVHTGSDLGLRTIGRIHNQCADIA
jgi:hypothetical protein